MLSITQKQDVYAAVKKSFSIASKTFTPSCLYSNQVKNSQSYPYITLNYVNEANQEQGAIGNRIDSSTNHGQRSSAFMSINVEAKDAQTLKRHDIAAGIAGQLWTDIQTNWQELSSGTVKLLSISQVRNLTNVNEAAGVLDVARLQFDCRLGYSIIW